MALDTKRGLQIISGRSHPKLAKNVAKHLNTALSEPNLIDFSNGEIGCKLSESVRGSDVFIIQTHYKNINDSILEQAILIDAAKRASASRIIAVCPFYGYARQDRKASGREPITAKLVSDIFTTAGADRIMSIDLHSSQIQGFFDGPFDHLTAMPTLVRYIQQNFDDKAVIVSPDAGRVATSDRYSKKLGLDLAIIHKRRSKDIANSVEALDVVGEVAGKTCILIDDMIDTAGTLCAAAEMLKQHGAIKIYAMATHGILSGPAIQRIDASAIDQVIVTDTLPVTTRSKKIVTLSVSNLLAAAILAVFTHSSVSKLFGGENHI